ncbi:hypothetical protein [Amnibacterium kyonggiense]|uniref:hypothetical protein n=1 Tax=Amnibacterium kyonggiense TaxID=595671 RepID=UPI0031E1ED98
MANHLCVCGHAHDAHEHYRRGTDCAICGAETCPKFRRALLKPSQPPTPPARPTGQDVPSSGTAQLVTGPLAIVSDLRTFARRRLSAS